MLTREKLVELYRDLRAEPVLSVYLDGEGDDPAKRNVWRKQFEHQVQKIRNSLKNRSTQEGDRFEEALSHVLDVLGGFEAFVPGKGWVAFATADQIRYQESVPVPMPHLVRWEEGIRVAPYIRGLKQSRVVVGVLVDSQRARLFRYHQGELYEPENVRADTFVGDLTDVNVSKRGSTHSGVRGKTGTDAAQRSLEVSSEKMLKELIGRISEMTGQDGFLLLGGSPEMVSQAVQAVPKGMEPRVAQRSGMHLDMSHPQVKEVVEEAASKLSGELQEALVTEVVNLAKADGRGILGREETERALRERRVDTLVLSRSFIASEPDFADHCIGTAFEQHAEVEEISEPGATLLDEEGEGIGARLRYRIRSSDEQEDAA